MALSWVYIAGQHLPSLGNGHFLMDNLEIIGIAAQDQRGIYLKAGTKLIRTREVPQVELPDEVRKKL